MLFSICRFQPLGMKAVVLYETVTAHFTHSEEVGGSFRCMVSVNLGPGVPVKHIYAGLRWLH